MSDIVGRTVRLSFSADTLGGLVLNEVLPHQRRARYRDRFTLRRGEHDGLYPWHNFAVLRIGLDN